MNVFVVCGDKACFVYIVVRVCGIAMVFKSVISSIVYMKLVAISDYGGSRHQAPAFSHAPVLLQSSTLSLKTDPNTANPTQEMEKIVKERMVRGPLLYPV